MIDSNIYTVCIAIETVSRKECILFGEKYSVVFKKILYFELLGVHFQPTNFCAYHTV